jgi:hypothetical protein
MMIHSAMERQATICIFNAAGQLVHKELTPSLNGHLLLLQQPAGFYWIKIQTESGEVSQRVGITN